MTVSDPEKLEELLDRYRVIADSVRQQLLDVMHLDGPQSSAELRRKVPDSKGSLRWDLTRLEGAGFIENVGGSGPEALWRVVPGAVYVTEDLASHPRMAPAVQEVERVAIQRRSDRMRSWGLERHTRKWSARWSDSSISRDYLLRLTPEELDDLDSLIDDAVRTVRERSQQRREAAGSQAATAKQEERVFVAVAAFPFRFGGRR